MAMTPGIKRPKVTYSVLVAVQTQARAVSDVKGTSASRIVETGARREIERMIGDFTPEERARFETRLREIEAERATSPGVASTSAEPTQAVA